MKIFLLLWAFLSFMTSGMYMSSGEVSQNQNSEIIKNFYKL